MKCKIVSGTTFSTPARNIYHYIVLIGRFGSKQGVSGSQSRQWVYISKKCTQSFVAIINVLLNRKLFWFGNRYLNRQLNWQPFTESEHLNRHSATGNWLLTLHWTFLMFQHFHDISHRCWYSVDLNNNTDIVGAYWTVAMTLSRDHEKH